MTQPKPPLSPAAQAVLDAWLSSERGQRMLGDPACLAAALRAAADQPYEVPIRIQGDDYWIYRNGIESERERNRTIAAELENFNA